ncbi:MAG: hypothetical protein MUO62_13300 [Anaerolineales bacterium]|nr:hypothetical protein [Anaerolineales bacterium]
MIEAFEIELHRELKKLAKRFKDWENGDISSDELSDRIHEYERGASRKLYHRYNSGDNAFNVAYAIVSGMIDQGKVPIDLLEAIQGPLGFYQDLKDRDKLKYPGEEGG